MKALRTRVFASAIALMTAAATAEPVVKSESVSVAMSNDTVTISYELETDPGVVTVDIQTNGVSIGGQYLTRWSRRGPRTRRPTTWPYT